MGICTWLHSLYCPHESIIKVKLLLRVNERNITELEEDEVERIFYEYISKYYPEEIVSDEDYIEVIPTDY